MSTNTNLPDRIRAAIKAALQTLPEYNYPPPGMDELQITIDNGPSGEDLSYHVRFDLVVPVAGGGAA
jgi:hypothetical protein